MAIFLVYMNFCSVCTFIYHYFKGKLQIKQFKFAKVAGTHIYLIQVCVIKYINENNMLTRKSSCVNARGTPPSTWQVLCLRGGGGCYPIQSWWGVPHTVMVGGVSGWGWGPQVPPPSRPGWDGVPLPSRPGMGYPPIQTCDGVPPSQS